MSEAEARDREAQVQLDEARAFVDKHLYFCRGQEELAIKLAEWKAQPAPAEAAGPSLREQQIYDIWMQTAAQEPPHQSDEFWPKFVERLNAALAAPVAEKEQAHTFMLVCPVCGRKSPEIEWTSIVGCSVCNPSRFVQCAQAGTTGQPLDLEKFYADLVDGLVIKESDGEPWPLTKSEARQIVDELQRRADTPATVAGGTRCSVCGVVGGHANDCYASLTTKLMDEVDKDES